MIFIYNILFLLLLILFSPVILTAFALKPKFRAGFWQKTGFYKKSKNEKIKTIWVHAVSVGEVNAVEGFVKKLHTELPDCNLVLSTVTRTGQEVATNKLSKFTDRIIYFPYDLIFSVIAAINAIKPDLVIVAETEIWPNFTNELNKRNIPQIVINGRISPSSHKGYKKFSFFFKEILSKYTLILMQTKGDRDRIIEIGAPADITQVMGNLKFDITNVLSVEDVNGLKNELRTHNFKVLTAASTHNGEDEILLDVFTKLKSEFNDLKLLIAPRHPERQAPVTDLIRKTGLSYGLRSAKNDFEQADIILLDTMGELGKLYAVSHLAFIGGSFSGTGGHNPLEAAIYNVPTLSGPTVFNFKDIYKFLTDANASILLNNKDELQEALRALLLDYQKYGNHSSACKSVFETNSGALDFAIEKVKSLII